jgi:hypothetical protein
MTHRIPLPLLDKLAPPLAIPGAAALILLIAIADYSTGYEVRLSILYLAPIALATWTAGIATGAAAAALASVCWLFSFTISGKPSPCWGDFSPWFCCWPACAGR